MKISKILLPVDFSQHGFGAVQYAGALARHFKAEVTLLHVNALALSPAALPPELFGPIDTGWITGLEAQRRKDLVSYRNADFHDVHVNRVVVTGDPTTQIVEYAHREKTDLIVMPTHGCGPFRRFLLGSVTAKVLHDTNCPVWTGVHMQESSTHQWKSMTRVLCAVDGGPASERVLDWAWSFASDYGARLTVMHAIPRLEAPDDMVDPDWRKGRLAEADAQLGCLLRKADARGDIVIEEGNPAKVVTDVATRIEAGVVVIGRSPKEGFLGRLRENAYAIISGSACPVISV